ncbi:hypothetical protein A3Q56_01127 [Intoshia linei]|uniref:Uncharacterized protein n=1 Tax=Intoshia linei TaxID=1819745 RepID=A0A177BBS7_9BILA|nr:hypothetical protein A3Q56_01127 [Intoshia linei]
MEEEISKMAAMDNFSFNRIAKIDFIEMSFKKRNSQYDNTPPTCHNSEELKIMLQNKCDKGMRSSITMDDKFYHSIMSIKPTSCEAERAF